MPSRGEQIQPGAAVVRKGPIAWMAANPVAANLLMLTLAIGGLLMSFRLRKEVFPRVDPDLVSITVPYPGASPAEVEQGILLAIEEAVRPLDGIKEVRATALEGVGTVEAELEIGADKTKALADVKNAVDRITTLPNEAERPVVALPEWRAEAISVVLSGDQSDKVLHALAERVRDELLALPEVSYVELTGVRPLEIAVEVPQDALRRYGLSLPGIADLVRRTALELPAGGVKTPGGEVLLRTAERRDLGREFADIPVIAGEGRPVRLGDIARIVDGFAETDVEAAFDGQPAVSLEVYSIGDQSPTDVAEAVKAYVRRLAPGLPPGMSVTTWHDHSKLYQERLDLLFRNAGIGLVLVLLILGVFLEPKLAFWVMMGIPISFLGSLVLLPVLDVSVNMISLFAFIVTLGMVVDDAIVVGENTFRFRRQGQPPIVAAVRGTRQVATPVFFSVATTLAAFTPLLMVPGIRGKIMQAIPVVVILVLSVSLLESFFVLPAHLAHLRPPARRGLFGIFTRIPSLTRLQQRFSLAFERFVARFYGPLVDAAVRQRWITLAIGVALLLAAFGLTHGGVVKYVDWPREESDRVRAEARLPFGAPVAETRAVMDRMVRAAQEVIRDNGGERISPGIFSMVGQSMSHHDGSSGGHIASVRVGLVPSDQRPIGSAEFARQWRRRLGEIPGLEALTFDSSTGHYSKPIDLELSHSDPRELEAAAVELADMLASYQGVKDIENGIELGKPQLDLRLSPAGIAAGLTARDLAAQLRGAFYGSEALRQQRGRNELKVLVRLPRRERETLHSVERMTVRLPAGGEMPLRQAAGIRVGRAYTAIRRTDGRRVLRVLAEVDDERANAQEVLAALMADGVPRLLADHPGLRFGLSGRQRDNKDFTAYLWLAFPLALIVMYLMIAVPLRSFLQPLFVVMAAIPFGYVGAVVGHLLMGFPLSMISLLGVVALAGVVVNDSIVLVDTANRFRDRGLSPVEAIRAAARQRFRPILLTSLTTFAGLAPMIFETSVQARMLIPMAISLGFGVISSTLIVLLLVPALFVLDEHLRLGLRAFYEYLFPGDSSGRSAREPGGP